MNLKHMKVAIVGAGIGGLAAAIALAQRGAMVTVLEQAPALREVGAGLQIGPNSIAILEALGLRDSCEAVASLPAAIELRDFRKGRLVARLPVGALSLTRHGRPYWQMHRADLLAVLANGAREAGVELRLGAVVEAVNQCDGVVTTSVGGDRITADLLIAADGVRSGIRGRLFGGGAPRFTGHVAWRGLIDARRLPEEAVPRTTCVTMGPGRHVVSYPLRGGALINVVAVEERSVWAAEGWSHPDDPAAPRTSFADWHPGIRVLLQALDETFLWGLFDHAPLPEWVAGRVALLGDACHPMLPFLAQGAAMALEDAWVLAAELDVAQTPEQGLRAYAARRIPRTTRVQRAAARNGGLYHLATPGVRDAVHTGLRLASKVAPGALFARYDWLYGADLVSALATE